MLTPDPRPRSPAPSAHPAAWPDELLLAQCDLGRTRSSGPGGQHRNKVETKVVITHRPTGASAQAGERRSAVENKRVALFRLRLWLAAHHRRPVPAGDVRSDLWKSRCPDGSIVCSPEHADFPALLAEAMDVVYACGLEPQKPALRLGCTMSQLVKLVKDCPAAFEQWNRDRAARGLHPMR